jgi:hypothetical protein
MTRADSPPTRIQLRGGQVQWIRAERHTQFIGLAGSFAVTEAPRWLGGSPWQAGVMVHAGQAHEVNGPGWVQLSAGSDAELLCVPAQGAAHSNTLRSTLRTVARRTFA